MMLRPERRILLREWVMAAGWVAGLHAPPLHAVPAPQDLAEKKSMQIRVRIAPAAATARVRGLDLRFVEEGRGGARRIAAKADQVGEWRLTCKKGKVLAAHTASRARLELRAPVTIETPAGFLQYQGRPFREALQIHADAGTCEVVNLVDLEKYLDGLVNSEFSSRWNEEAVASQVVAARTYALFQLRQARARKGSRFDVDNTVRDQVYDGSHKEDFRASRSVERTRGMILTAGTGKNPLPLKAFYHSTCGGMTDLPERVWGGKFAGFKRAVRCPYCAVSPVYQWELRLGQEDIARALAANPRKGWEANWREWFSRGKLIGIQVSKTDEQGRALELSTRWSLGPRIADFKIGAAQFRGGVGVARLKSTWFSIKPFYSGGKPVYAFNGRGNGHGVGLCQWGAKVMGEKGFKMASILKFYYPDAQLKKIW